MVRMFVLLVISGLLIGSVLAQDETDFIKDFLSQASSMSLQKEATPQKLIESFANRFESSLAEQDKYKDLIRLINNFAHSGTSPEELTKEVRLALPEETENVPKTKAVIWVFTPSGKEKFFEKDVKEVRWVFYLTNRAKNNQPANWIVVNFSKTIVKKNKPGQAPGFLLPDTLNLVRKLVPRVGFEPTT